MPSLYDDLFEDSGKKNKPTDHKPEPIDLDNDRFQETGKESLDEILILIKQFTTKAEPFSQLLTRTRAVDYEVEKGILDFFLIAKDKHDQGSLANERSYYAVLQTKFTAIITPMLDLGHIHLQTIKQFNRDIDKDYYSIEKTDKQVQSDKEIAIDHINIQRKILADAATSLSILEEALTNTEDRLRTYIDIGGINNISRSECEILAQKRISLTSGQLHQFDYSFFKINLLDKTAIAMGMYLKETTSQYLGKLSKVFG
ncbi:hypothetical protein D1818_17455 [Aquimarina sp. BL5]|uniref:hypothetical protein n=1 Tax=Aquimarina sp. BL5 TaxID=1714860 RepID=UPI000E4AAA89|nr:hypothetical protein [Aquimarina sp. BL5]AXT52531.1 hypothetical protein D1818_17455 [Aquimarina sp. BL5]RKN11282.1 hypothetical protein D7036_01340 [Aquimarina sp. BL5]